MKILIPQEKLKKGLGVVEKISSKSLTLPILNNILISTEKNFLNLTATNLEIGINWWVLGKIEKQGKTTIPSRLFSGYINLLPSKNISLEAKNNNLYIECENNKTQIKTLSAEEFPLIPKINEKAEITVKSSLFCQNLNQVADIAVPSTTRPEISGIYLLFQKDLITMAATDSFRLGEKKMSLRRKSSLDKEYSLIIPQKTVKEIINIFGEKDGDLKIYFSSNQIMFEYLMSETPHPETQLISRLIEGEYPNYQEIIPKKYTTQLVLNKEEFLNQVKAASLFSGKINEVKVKISPKDKKVYIFSQSPDIGEYESSVSGKIKGEPITVSFNHRFLLDGLFTIKSDQLAFNLSGDSGPGVLRPEGDDTYLYVVMPIKGS